MKNGPATVLVAAVNCGKTALLIFIALLDGLEIDVETHLPVLLPLILNGA